MSAHNLETRLKQLLSARHFLTAGEMVQLLAMQGQPFNKTSVYRALSRLLAAGQLCEHYFTAPQGLVYELRENHHDHVACERCGQVWQLACSEAQSRDTGGAALPEDFVVSHHHVTWFGLCADCQLTAAGDTKRPAAQ